MVDVVGLGVATYVVLGVVALFCLAGTGGLVWFLLGARDI